MTTRYRVVFLSEDATLLEDTERQLSKSVDYFKSNFPAEAESKALTKKANLIAIDSRIAGGRGHSICEELHNHYSISVLILNPIFLILFLYRYILALYQYGDD